MTVCYFGMYAPNYSRNRILIKGLRENGVSVIECNDRGHLIYGLRYPKLIYKFFQTKSWKADIFVVGFPGQTDVPLAFIFAKLLGKRVVFDAFYSLYVSQVFDRKYIKKGSWKATLYFFIDWFSCFLADKVILDTNAHINYFVKTFSLPKEKYARIFVGTDPAIIKPYASKKHPTFRVGFHGSFLPLQGVPIILEAAKLLKKQKITFLLLGNGIELAKCQKIVSDYGLQNVQFLKEVPYKELAHFIASTDLYLGGPFGASLKSNQVIPNKVYEALAVRKPVILGESKAMRELFVHKVHGYFVKQGSGKALANAILALKKNKLLRDKMAKEGYNLIHMRVSPKQLGSDLINEFNF